MWNLQNKIKQNKTETDSDTENELMIDRGLVGKEMDEKREGE